MQHSDEMIEYYEQEQPLNIKEFLFRILSKWYWFAICGFLGLSLAWINNRYLVSIWRVEATVLISDESKNTGVDNLFERLSLGKSVNMDNQIGLLKSYNLILQTIENLGWRTSWIGVGRILDREYYKNEPYKVIEPDGVVNPSYIPIYVNVISEDRYRIKYKFNQTIGGKVSIVEINQEGKLSVPFISPIFRFTLEKGPGKLEPATTYYFRFNNTNDMTLGYQGKLSVNVTTKTSEILKLSVMGSQPEREVDFLNKLTNVYIQFGLREKNRTSENTVLFIDNQLAGIADSLRIAGQSVTNFRTENQIVNLSQEGDLVIRKLEALESEKAISDMRLIYYRNLRSYITSANGMKQAVSPSVIGITDPTLNNMVLKLSELYSRREVLSYSALDKNPALLMLDNEIQSTRNSLGENLTNLETNAETELKNLKIRIEEVNKSVAQLPKTEQKMINIKRRFDVNNDLYTFLLTKRAEAAITRASNVADAQIIDEARLETSGIIGPDKQNNLLIGLMIGLGLPLIIILLLDFFNDTIKNREEVERATSIPIVGMIGHNIYDKEFAVTEHPRSAISESFRGLRTNLQYILREQEQNVIGIHSAIPGEGKSFISLNLACIMAMNNKKVLLVAVDMHKPRLNLIFGMDHHQDGLSTYLINQNKFSEIVRPTLVENLSYVSSGPIPPNPAELLENGGFERFITEARVAFDFVILDNPPVSIVTDGIISGRYSDTNLFLVRQGYSHKPQLKFIDQLATKNTMQQICIVINDIEAVSYGYGKKYGYNGKYGNYGYGGYIGYYDDIHRPKGLERVIAIIKKRLKKILK
ncbi:MAG: polysaccharide biosynthesis tyrosine autokinase [Bacteroidia bacterium]|nr:polysaccharide biosynthesis tyrosine autokinase [Bacteroidia bacterium]